MVDHVRSATVIGALMFLLGILIPLIWTIRTIITTQQRLKIVREGNEISVKYSNLRSRRELFIDPRIREWKSLSPEDRVKLRSELDKWFRDHKIVDAEAALWRKKKWRAER